MEAQFSAALFLKTTNICFAFNNMLHKSEQSLKHIQTLKQPINPRTKSPYRYDE